MFNLTHELPRSCLVAVSGGVDSAAALHWLTNKPGRVAGIVHVDHGTSFSRSSHDMTEKLALKYKLPFHVFAFSPQYLQRKQKDSLEAIWRDMRYKAFDEACRKHKLPIVLAHNFNDCLEEYLMCTTVRGYIGTIPYRHGPCIRPFRTWKRAAILDYARKNNLEWVEDPSNEDDNFLRTRFRFQVAPIVQDINPGIWNIVRKAMDHQDEYSGCLTGKIDSNG